MYKIMSADFGYLSVKSEYVELQPAKWFLGPMEAIMTKSALLRKKILTVIPRVRLAVSRVNP